MIELDDDLRAAMLEHAAAEEPRECCGLLVELFEAEGRRYLPCHNVAPAGQDRFAVDPMDYALAEEQGEVLAVVHSHPNASANPSMADRVGCERGGLPWLVVGWPSGVIKQIEPDGWTAPYVGREFCHGVLDCYTLVQDWYWRELRIELPDAEREDEWWTTGQDLYMQGFAAAGFLQVTGLPQRHDLALMQVLSNVANHAAVFVGGGNILHHLFGRLSGHDVYGGYWERHTLALVRHHSLVQRADRAVA